MADPIKINMNLPAHRARVMFKDQQKPCFVIHADKVADDLKNFQEIANLLRFAQSAGMVNDRRVTFLAGWLETLNDEYSTVT